MTISKAEFANGYANVYNEFGQKVHAFPCNALIGYGAKGIVVKRFSMIVLIDMNCRQRTMPEFQFNKEQFALHDDYLQVRC